MLNSHREKNLNVTNVSITCTNIDVFKDTINVWNALNVKRIHFTHFELNIHIANIEIRNLHVTHVQLKCEKSTSGEAQKTKCKKCEESFTPFKLNSYTDNKDSRNFKCYSFEVSFIKTDYLQGTKNI